MVAGFFKKAAQLGALIKRADVFEQLPSCDVVVLDKTGTLTTAEQRVSLDGVSDLLAEGLWLRRSARHTKYPGQLLWVAHWLTQVGSVKSIPDWE